MSAVDEQIRDLQQLAEMEAESEEAEDSDAEDMRRIITKNISDSDEEMSEGDDDEEGEASDEEMLSEEGEAEMSSDSDGEPKLRGKKALRA